MSLINRDTSTYLNASLALSHPVAHLFGRMTATENVC